MHSHAGHRNGIRNALSLVVPVRPVRLLALLASLAAVLVLLAGERGPGELPRHEVLFGVMAYVIGPGGLAVASTTLLSQRSLWQIPVALATYLLSVAAFILFAVNVGAIAP